MMGEGNVFSLFTPGRYLPWPGGIPTLVGVPTLDRRDTYLGGFLPWTGGVATLDRRGSYLGQEG